ncbi:MAG: hypothetical protein ACI9K2_005464 [Myxococcota bacterium]|jgi:hypothetical protein
MRHASLLVPLAALSLGSSAPADHATPPLEPVTPLALALDAVRVGPLGGTPPSRLVSCDARWINRTGGPLSAATNFSGVFDAVWLVGVDRDGQEVLRTSYSWHQSPMLEARPVQLADDETGKTLGFPLHEPPGPEVARYRLEGGLVGNARFDRVPASEWRGAVND